jgi:membrane-bound hydrogenase subunit beta
VKAEMVVEDLKKALGPLLEDVRIQDIPEGSKRRSYQCVWVNIRKEGFLTAVRTLFRYGFPHLGILTGEDMGEDLRLVYIFKVFYEEPREEVTVVFSFHIPKSEPVVPSLTPMIPGASTNEREIREMLGVEFRGLKDKRHLFLPEDWPEGKYPWRKDETNVEDMVKRTR